MFEDTTQNSVSSWLENFISGPAGTPYFEITVSLDERDWIVLSYDDRSICMTERICGK